MHRPSKALRLRPRSRSRAARRILWGLSALGLLGASLGASKEVHAAEAAPPRFALVIGSNATATSDQAPLRYADDDAARMAELQKELGAEVVLLTSFDGESQARYPELVREAKAPTLRELRLAWDQLRDRMRDAGEGSELWIYYSGHGDVGPDGQGYLVLEEGKLTRAELFNRILGRSTAAQNHLIIDACESEQLVAPRGEWKDDRIQGTQDVRDYLERQHLAKHPTTGVILATSVDQQTHEWDRYQGGIFTHQVLSGMRGAADLNGDGRIEYSELGAFVSAANRGVSDPRAHLQVVVHAPARDQRHPIVHFPKVDEGRVLFVAQGDTHHYSIEDDRGVRVADLRPSGVNPAYLRLPAERALWITREDKKGEPSEAQLPASGANQDALLLASAMKYEAPRRQSRGALAQAFRAGLFQVPYGPGYYAGYTASTGLLAVEDPDWKVTVWKKENGELVEVQTVEGTCTGGDCPDVEIDPDRRSEAAEALEEAAEELEEAAEELEEAAEAFEDGDFSLGFLDRHWGSVSIGSSFTPFVPDGQIRLGPDRITSNQFSGLGPWRGADLRWWTFRAKDHKDFPGWEGYFRLGFEQGSATFLPPEGASFGADDPVALSYTTVPIFWGFNTYMFKKWPVRPFVGAGVGFDVLRLDYTLDSGSHRRDTSARIGFELHAGLEARITNYVSLTGEVRQLWSAQRKLPGVPNYSNEGLTLISGVRVGFPLESKKKWEDRQRRVKERRARRKANAAEELAEAARELDREREGVRITIDGDPAVDTTTTKEERDAAEAEAAAHEEEERAREAEMRESEELEREREAVERDRERAESEKAAKAEKAEKAEKAKKN